MDICWLNCQDLLPPLKLTIVCQSGIFRAYKMVSVDCFPLILLINESSFWLVNHVSSDYQTDKKIDKIIEREREREGKNKCIGGFPISILFYNSLHKFYTIDFTERFKTIHLNLVI